MSIISTTAKTAINTLPIKQSGKKKLTDIILAAEHLGFSLKFILFLIEYYGKENGFNFKSLDELSQEHPALNLDVKKNLQNKIQTMTSGLDVYEHNSDKFEFIRFKTGIEFVSKSLTQYILTDEISLDVLSEAITFFASSIAENGNFKRNSSSKVIYSIREKEDSNEIVVVSFTINIKAEVGSAYIFFDKSICDIDSELKSKSFNNVQELIKWSSQ